MSDRANASIIIGGKLKKHLAQGLIDAIRDDGASTDWGEPTFSSETLLDATTKYGSIRFVGEDLNQANFVEIEQFCIDHKLHFQKWTGQCLGAWDSDVTDYYPPTKAGGKGKFITRPTNNDDQLLVHPAAISKVITCLERKPRHCASASHPAWRIVNNAIRQLKGLITVRQVPKFQIV